MKKSISLLIACIMAAGMSLTAAAETTAASSAGPAPIVWGQAAEKRGLVHIKSNLYYTVVDDWADIKVPVLKKSRTIKNCFVLKENESLVIPAGNTLKLTGGADIRGDIYIEDGGRLVIDKLSTYLSGTILCYGDISVTNGTFTCVNGSTLYIAECGSLNASDRGADADGLNGRVGTDMYGASVVCLGECNIPDPTFVAEPVAAVYRRTEFGGVVKKTEVITDGLDALLDTELTTDTYYGDSSFYDLYTVFFSGGGCVDLVAMGNKQHGWSNIAGANVQAMCHAARIYHDSCSTA